jgi:type IV pilus modification protein PilV
VNTDPRRHPAEQGFTLIEVMIAMVILAVGLLGLEALGVGAARMVNRAERENAMAAIAADTLERTLGRVRATGVANVNQQFDNTPTGDSIRLSVQNTGRLTTVTVTAIPKPTSSVLGRADSIQITGNVFR